MKRATVGVALALLFIPTALVAQGSRITSRHASITPERGGVLIMAIGDSLRIQGRAYDCYGDQCLVNESARRAEWTSESPDLLVSSQGLVRARRPGVFGLRVRVGGLSTRDSVRVLLPVRDLVWSHRPARVLVGDTLRIAVVARDSSGQTVRRLPVSEHIGGTGRSGEIVWWDRDGFSGLYVNKPGLIELVGRLADRTDTLRIQAVVRLR